MLRLVCVTLKRVLVAGQAIDVDCIDWLKVDPYF